MTTLTGRQIDLFRMATLISGIKFEARTNGMKLARGPSCTHRAKKEFGLKGNRDSVLAQMEKIYMDAQLGVWPEGYVFKNGQDRAKAEASNE